MAATRVTLGRVAGVYGIKGWLRIDSQTRPVEKILTYPNWWFRQGEQVYQVQRIDGRVQGQGVVVQIRDPQGQVIEDRDIAAKLIGALVEVSRDDLPPLPQGQFYWVDLIGLKALNPAGGVLGTVKEMTSNGAQDVLVVVDEAGVQRLIPFIREHIVKEVDLAGGRIVCEWELDY
ncbi:MAG: ribosome maturation factor RimM [Pseudomonadota bacterium]|nr:ribosome maturation factor RimM [Pseudomonadota bacterium]